MSRADAPRCRPVETLKNRLRACLAVASEQDSCRDSMPFSI